MAAAVSPARRWIILAMGLVLASLAALYVFGALEHSRRVNTDASTFDQSAYLHYAGQMRATGYGYVGGRNRMPLYPFLQSLVYSSGLDEQQRFERAKRLNIALSVLALIVLYPILRRWLPPLATFSLILISAFMVFIFKAAYVQCELVYYLLAFCSFLCMLRFFESPGWRLGLLSGALLGLTQLTKASALPGLVCFCAVAGVWLLARALRAGRTSRPGLRVADLATVGLVAVGFLAVVFPYIMTSKRVFGRYFYNVNSTFYIWYDTQEQVANGTRLHGDRDGWPDMPADQIPGPARYFREHDAGQIVGRVVNGLRHLHQTAMKSYGYYKYLLLHAGFALAVVVARPRSWFPLSPAQKVQVFFCLCYFAGYLVLIAWSTASLWGANRIGLQLFLPMMFCFALVIEASSRRLPAFQFRGMGLQPARLFQAGILCLLAPDIYVVLTSRLMAMAGGH